VAALRVRVAALWLRVAMVSSLQRSSVRE